MIGVSAMVAVIFLMTGAVLIVLGLRPAPVRPGKPPRTLAQQWAHATRRPAGAAGRRRDLLWAGAVLSGVVVYIALHQPLALVLVPTLVILGPRLLGSAPQTNIALMQALDQWVREIAATLPQGLDVTQAIRNSRTRAPQLISAEVGRMVRRMDAGLSPEEALQQMADDLDDSEADAVLASLKLAMRLTRGASDNLKAIADNLQDRIAVLRDIEAERTKPRVEARNITIVSALMLLAISLGASQLFASLSTPLGLLLVVACTIVFGVSSAWMYRMTIPRRRARILIARRPQP